MSHESQWSDDALYAWFVRAVAEEAGSAEEIAPGVVRVVLEPDENDDGKPAEQVDILITREQLRSMAWSTVDVSDDRDFPALTPAADPVLAGLQLLAVHLEEDLCMLLPDERYLVFFDGRLHSSVRRELPPVPGTFTWLEPGGGYLWKTAEKP